MNDAKNILIAWLSAGSPLLAAAASETGVTILSAVVLPILFFTIGKAIDVLLHIYLAGSTKSGTDYDVLPSSSPSSTSVVGLSSRHEGRTTEEDKKEEPERKERD